MKKNKKTLFLYPLLSTIIFSPLVFSSCYSKQNKEEMDEKNNLDILKKEESNDKKDPENVNEKQQVEETNKKTDLEKSDNKHEKDESKVENDNSKTETDKNENTSKNQDEDIYDKYVQQKEIDKKILNFFPSFIGYNFYYDVNLEYLNFKKVNALKEVEYWFKLDEDFAKNDNELIISNVATNDETGELKIDVVLQDTRLGKNYSPKTYTFSGFKKINSNKPDLNFFILDLHLLSDEEENNARWIDEIKKMFSKKQYDQNLINDLKPMDKASLSSAIKKYIRLSFDSREVYRIDDLKIKDYYELKQNSHMHKKYMNLPFLSMIDYSRDFFELTSIEFTHLSDYGDKIFFKIKYKIKYLPNIEMQSWNNNTQFDTWRDSIELEKETNLFIPRSWK